MHDSKSYACALKVGKKSGKAISSFLSDRVTHNDYSAICTNQDVLLLCKTRSIILLKSLKSFRANHDYGSAAIVATYMGNIARERVCKRQIINTRCYILSLDYLSEQWCTCVLVWALVNLADALVKFLVVKDL